MTFLPKVRWYNYLFSKCIKYSHESVTQCTSLNRAKKTIKLFLNKHLLRRFRIMPSLYTFVSI